VIEEDERRTENYNYVELSSVWSSGYQLDHLLEKLPAGCSSGGGGGRIFTFQ